MMTLDAAQNPEAPLPMRHPRLFLAILGLALCLGATNTMAAPQSRSADDLARENERLKMELQDLRSKLAAATKRIGELEQAIATGGGTDTAPLAPKPTVIVKKSPYGMVQSVRDDYRAAVEAGEIPAADDLGGEAARIRYRRAAEKWVLDRNRQYKTRTTWPVVIEEIRPIDRETGLAVLRAVSPDSNAPAGESFEVRFPAKMTPRLEREMAKQDADTAPVQLDVIFIPNLRLRPDLMERGPFHDASYIGPMVEMDWDLSFKNLSRSTARPKPS